ncbi:MAG: class I SAM-dependent methyltransferase [Magnetococcales bacterium]|nr:class I SAM-dependent methyltransferase [Magnetococcales bacterium]NGZ27395.1 class I SAM-dependent methyltransferase [Magnetococcales bacterium]
MAAEGFKDHFSTVAGTYANYRPFYPATLFNWLATLSDRHELAWDCGTGNGQAAVVLANHFHQVFASDASSSQIDKAIVHERVRYQVAVAQDSGLPERSVDLILVAQALHWFDLPAFYQEVQRVLHPDGAVVAVCYGVLQVEGEEVNHIVQEFYGQTLAPYWPPERRHVETAYQTLPFPFQTIDPPHLAMTTQWNLSQLLGYFRSWSAVVAFNKAMGYDPVEPLASLLTPVWGEPTVTRRMNWPLGIRAGRLA